MGYERLEPLILLKQFKPGQSDNDCAVLEGNEPKMALALQGRTAVVVVAIVLIALGAFSFNHVSRSAENSGNAGALLSQLREENAALRTAVDRLEDVRFFVDPNSLL